MMSIRLLILILNESTEHLLLLLLLFGKMRVWVVCVCVQTVERFWVAMHLSIKLSL